MQARIALGFLAAALCGGVAVQAEPLDPVYSKAYGGTYSLDCDDAGADRLEVLADRLVDRRGSRERVGTEVSAVASFYGGMPPTHFELALVASFEREKGAFLVYEDEQGIYIKLEDQDEARYSKCESKAKAHAETQCAGPEGVVFHCEIEDKSLSVCLLEDERVSYRFGKLGEPEITIDSVANSSLRAYPGGGER